MFILRTNISREIFNPIRYFILQDSKRLNTTQKPQQNDIHPISKQLFDDACLITLVRIQTAFENLKAEQTNKKQDLIRNISLQGISRLEVESNLGWFIFDGQSQLSTLFFTSPFNGVFKYYYDLNSKRWISNKDKHILQQNLAREIQGKFFAYLDI